MKKPVELLAPAGSYESMVAAVNAGADAVYIGGMKFGARAYANNLDEEMMKRAIDFVHLHGCSLYMTVNTLFKEEELDQLYGYLEPLYQQGLDAVIVQDLGAFSLIRECFPDLPVHASTQMTVNGPGGARLLKEAGAKRVVTARELSLKELKEIHDACDIEIESFIHGALCYCYSGQCLLSSLIGGRSGNRGRCAQPCRLPYEVRGGKQVFNPGDEKYVLSPKDLCTLDIIPDIIEAGVFSMKIEGRMKSPRYTAGVVSVYRKYIDHYLEHGREGYQVKPADRQMLLELFDRGGFSGGYYKQHNGRDMIALKEKPASRQVNQALFDQLDSQYVNGEKKEKIKGKVKIQKDLPAIIELQCQGVCARAEGAVPLPAMKQPLTAESLQKQLMKTGNTPFAFENLEVMVEEGLFMPVQAQNELRRQGLEALERALTGRYTRTAPGADLSQVWIQDPDMTVIDKDGAPEITVYLEQEAYLDALLPVEGIGAVYLDGDVLEPERWGEAVKRCHSAGKRCYLAFPHIFWQQARAYFDIHLTELREAGFDGWLLKTLEAVGYVEERKLEGERIFDHSLYLFNNRSARVYKGWGMDRQTLPLELNYRELKRLNYQGEMVVYGRLPVMVSNQCVTRTTRGCSHRPETLYLKDRTGAEFAVRNHCTFCYNTIYNANPLSLLDNASEVLGLNPLSVRLQFTVEPAREAEQIARSFVDAYRNGKKVSGKLKNFTRGHFKRGVE